jgi:membrane-associated protein
MELLHKTFDLILHLDKHLNEWAGQLGAGLYVVLFLIVFCETGLVVTPFLPGDSLLFGVGALAASSDSTINVWVVGVILSAAAVLGDAANYAIGRRLGPKVFHSESSKLLNKEHLMRAHRFYEKHGGKTIIIARFVPIIRTFAPFVAGIGEMGYTRFAAYNIVGGVAWVWSILLGGYFLVDRVPWIKNNFSVVTLIIIAISLVPVVVEFIKARRGRARGFDPILRATTLGEKAD